MDLADRLRIAKDWETPIVVQLTEQLTWLIASGVIQKGDTLPPIRVLAEEIGVHMHTVREAYHRLEANQLVTVRTRMGTTVLAFDAHRLVREKKDLRSFLIGVLMPAPAPIYQPYIQGIQEASAPYGWMPLFTFTQDNPFLTERFSYQLIAKRVDGLIVTSPGEIERFHQMVRSESLPPIVYVDAPHISQNSVSPDSEGAAYAATHHLVEHGHTRIGFITAPLDWENVEPCYAGYRRALEDSGLEIKPELIVEIPDFDPRSGYEGAMTLVAHNECLGAVFVAADDLALGVMEALREQGLGVPQDVAVTSYGDIASASISNPGLTTAHLPSYEMGFHAVEQLESLFRGEVQAHEPLFLDCPLILRQSCGCSVEINHQKE